MSKSNRLPFLPIFLVLLSGCSMLTIIWVWSPLVSSFFDSSGFLSFDEPSKVLSISMSKPKAVEAAEPSGSISIPPSEMEVHYHEMWNHTTNTISVPEKYRNPFNLTVIDEKGHRRRPLTSLEILDNVLNGDKYRAEFKAVEAYMEGKIKEVPQCLVANIDATRELANKVVQARSEPKATYQRPTQLPLPFLNVGFPKVGSNTLMEFFDCLGMRANHGQNGELMFDNLAMGINLFGNSVDGRRRENAMAYTQLDRNTISGYYPQVSLLDELHELGPNSTLIFQFRPIHDWIRSVSGWNVMKGAMSRFIMPGLILNDKQRTRNAIYKQEKKLMKNKALLVTELQLAKWWCGHALHIREYVREYPTHSLIEMDLYDTDGTSDLLHDLFQVDADAYWENERKHVNKIPERPEQCWGHGNKTPDQNISFSDKVDQHHLKQRERNQRKKDNVYMTYDWYKQPTSAVYRV